MAEEKKKGMGPSYYSPKRTLVQKRLPGALNLTAQKITIMEETMTTGNAIEVPPAKYDLPHLVSITCPSAY